MLIAVQLRIIEQFGWEGPLGSQLAQHPYPYHDQLWTYMRLLRVLFHLCFGYCKAEEFHSIPGYCILASIQPPSWWKLLSRSPVKSLLAASGLFPMRPCPGAASTCHHLEEGGHCLGLGPHPCASLLPFSWLGWCQDVPCLLEMEKLACFKPTSFQVVFLNLHNNAAKAK